jgi:hypothetical protein
VLTKYKEKMIQRPKINLSGVDAVLKETPKKNTDLSGVDDVLKKGSLILYYDKFKLALEPKIGS